MEVTILIEPDSLENELTALLTLITVQKKKITAFVHLHSLSSSEINYSEINIINMYSIFFTIDNRIIIKKISSLWLGTCTTLRKQSLNLKKFLYNWFKSALVFAYQMDLGDQYVQVWYIHTCVYYILFFYKQHNSSRYRMISKILP